MSSVCKAVVVVERRKKREISYQSPPEADVIFSPYALDSTCDVSLKPCVLLNCEVARLTTYSPTAIVTHTVRLHSLAVKLENLLPAIAFYFPEEKKCACFYV